MRRRAVGAYGWASLFALPFIFLSACDSGGESAGGSAAFADYALYAEALDDARPGFGRTLTFGVGAGTITRTRSQCGSLAGMAASFAGHPFMIDTPGGWTPALSDSGAPAEPPYSFCDAPFFRLFWADETGEPQNGTLDLDDVHHHLEVTFHQDMGNPAMELVSVTARQLVVRLKDFIIPPLESQLKEGFAWGLSRDELHNSGTLDGDLLTIPVPSGRVDGKPSDVTPVTLVLDVDLGEQVLPCVGFKTCMGTAHLLRYLDVDLPFLF